MRKVKPVALVLLLWCSCAAPTVRIVSLAAHSPNSLLASVLTTGAVSVRLGCSTDRSHSIVTPYLPVARSLSIAMSVLPLGRSETRVIAAQMEPSTDYNCEAIATGGALGGGRKRYLK